MTKREALDQFRHEIRKRNKSYQTEKTYVHWISRYSDWLKQNRDSGPADYLSFLADPRTPGVHAVSVSTQRQALNALAKFHHWVLKREREEWNFKPARKSRKVPDFLTLAEAHTLFGQMQGTPQLQAQLMFGTGLRVSECISLRIKDLDFQNHTITVRNGKGAKDRVVPMPRCLADPLREQIEKATHYWNVDREQGNPPPYLPESLATKLGKQIRNLAWFWVFPSHKLSTDPRSQIVRRHHVTDASVGSALRRATAKARLYKRVTCHVMRHSFATESLRNGLDIKSLAELLGHKSTATTEIYLHCLPDIAYRAVSPLDAVPQQIIPFPGPGGDAVPSTIAPAPVCAMR